MTTPARTADASVRDLALPLDPDFAPYVWTDPPDVVAAKHGVRPELVLRYDQNTPPLPGVPQIPLAESMARLHEYPDGGYRELCAAAAQYAGLRPENVVPGAGADDLILLSARVFLGPGRRAAIGEPTYAMYRIATRLTGADVVGADGEAELIWRCNPENPAGTVVEPEELVELARARPRAIVVVDEAYFEYGSRSCAPWVDELPNLVVVRTLSKAFGFASLRIGYALAHPDTAALLDERRAPGPIAGPAAAIGAAALWDPRLEHVADEIAECERVREVLAAAGYDVPPTTANFVFVHDADGHALAERLQREGLVVRGFAHGIRITPRLAPDNDVLLRALGAEPVTTPGRQATVLRTTKEIALRLTLDLDGKGRVRIATGVGFLDHLLTLFAFHAGFDVELMAGGDLHVDEHHLVEDTFAAVGLALAQALGDRTGVTRFGSATVPMDEAQATAAVDLVRRPHAEVALRFTGDRVGGLALTLLPHALERLAMEAGCTMHVEAAGMDDHHVAEAAFKALGRALRQAVALAGEGGSSTKGVL
jgi:histidinol-phosphate/aromatic aminotransferase/cobyric acid decarboxylase-like protein/imidazoleglycerol phosphate dehydratase HisB